MGSLADRRRKRREYLWKKGAAYTVGWISFVVFFTAQVAATWCLFRVACAIADAGMPQSTEQGASWPWVFLWTGSASLLLVSIAVSCAHYCDRKMEEADKLLRVPPVKHEALPAGEILVRGSGIPAIPPQDSLLRAAAARREEPAEELLRATRSYRDLR